MTKLEEAADKYFHDTSKKIEEPLRTFVAQFRLMAFKDGAKWQAEHVLGLIKSEEGAFIYPDMGHYGGCTETELCDWLESKLK